MLMDTSLTNTLNLSGISNIKYRTYTQSYTKEFILSYLSCEDLNTNPSYISLENSLINAYHHLISRNVPSQWHISSQTSDNVTLELWVFWFDDRHTETIDNSSDLKNLIEELKAGSFNWNQLTSNGLSPSGSPQPNSATSESTCLTPVKEYKLFINSIRNLIQHAMIKTKGAFPLGEFLIFPDIKEEDPMMDPMTHQSSSTILACMYNIYLTTTNLVFQPNARRMRLRPLNSSDALLKNAKVLLCPTGEHAKVISFQSLPTLDLQEKVLKQWAEFYRIPISQLSPTNNYLPSLVTIRTSSQDTIVYPSKLVFVPTDTKLTPAALAGMNGIMGLNHGLAEDLGSKVSRLAYHDRLKPSNKDMIDYWSYSDPVVYAGNTTIHALSMMDAKYQQDQLLLHRALVEPVIESPIMNSKSVIPFHFDSPALIRQLITPPNGTLSKTKLDLTEFAQSSFQINKQEQENAKSDLLNRLNPMQDPNVALAPQSSEISDTFMIEPEQKNDQQQIESQDILAAVLSEDSAAEQVSSTPVEQDYSMEGLMYDLNDGGGNPWDTNDDLNDFNLDVTEADFDFFETSAPVVVAPEMTPNVLNIMSIDANSPPPPVIKEAPIDDVDMEEAMTAPKTNFTPNNDSLFTPFVISNNGTDDLSIETTSTIDPNSSNSTPMMHHKQEQKASTSAFQHELAYKSTTEQFVPRDFLPVSVGTHVNDAKYCSGGKFMYVPPHLKKNKGNDTIEKISPLLAKVLKKRDFNYSPDYIPNLMATSKRKVFAKPNPIKTIGFEKPVLVSKDIHMTDMYSVTKRKISVSDTDGSENSSSSSSSSNSSTSSDDSDSGSSDDESIHQEHVVNKRLEALKQFQKSFVNSLLKATPAPLPRSETMDYDTPFASKLADGIMKPIKWRQSKAMEQSIDYLCQQAILGGYPFAGGLTEISQNGGEIGTEPAKVMAARRTNLMQVAHGAVTHVPSLQTDLNKLTMDFKAMLKQIFLYPEGADTATASDPISTPASEDLSMMTEPAAYMNSSLLGKIDVKGPLSIQKYYDLNEVHSQTHSKYGKYQIKKKRPDEPNLDFLKQPDIVVSRHDDFLEGSSKMIPFWEKLGLEPYSLKKHIKYFAVYPDNIDIKNSVIQFFQGLNSAYELCHLGRHDPGQVGTYHHGLVPVRLISISEEKEPSVRQRLKSYEETCVELGRLLANNDDRSRHTVIYIVNPGPHMSSYLDMCRCFYKLKEACENASHQEQKARLVLQLIPIDHILRTSAFGGYTLMGMKDTAFSVYSKCFSIITRKTPSAKENPKTCLYAPPFVLMKPLQRSIDFKLNSIRSFPIILNQLATLHMAYCFSYDRAWMFVVWIDDRGELLEYDLFSRKSAHKEAWKRTLEIAKRTEFPWTIVIAKVGLMFNDELNRWLRYTTPSDTDKYRVAIVCIDMESGLHLHFQTHFPDASAFLDTAGQNKSQQASGFLDASGKSRVLGHTRYQQDGDQQSSSTQLINSEAQILVLNHRISYSHKRDQAYKGILRVEAITEKENWMMPLATGYLIQHSLPRKSVNPCMEQFNNVPFIAEIHLLYNHTHHSAYSALHNIIKKFYALSFINPVVSSRSCIPFHIVLAERLSRLLLVIDESIKQ